MFGHTGVLSLALPFLVGRVVGQTGIQLDVSSTDSIKSAAKSLAGGIVSFYNETLQKDLTLGLFPDPYYWWEAGIVFNALIGYSYLTGDSQYDSLISEALQHQIGDHDAFMPPNQTKTLGNDDQSSWGLAAMTAAEVGFPKPANLNWIDLVVNVWNTQAERIDYATCGGGLKWQIFTFNNGYNYKNSMSNGNFFLLSARLAKFTGNSTYTQYANQIYKWSNDIGLVSDFHVFDGADDKKNCSQVNHIQWTAAHGVYTEGAALMFNMTGAQNWTDTVNGFVNASSVFQATKDNPVIIETACENNGKCDVDQRAFKGIFARTMARAALAAPFASGTISKILSASAQGAVSVCTSGGKPSCSLSWADADSKWEQASASDGNLGEVYDALEVVQGLLYPSAKSLQTANGGGSSSSSSATQSGGASRSSGASSPQNTGAAGTIAVSLISVLVVAIAAMCSV
ncbi:mannan endo-1,6-alpha-mannosidase [Setomelanomma holmii]|uniref:Mannan endo-1,6-alpha-mannosidase n=1 Tax=Setomelanomma holmii TaxID=210430 RepID=A0A9P4LMR8_9PLEO|nr:mannan endo-1,6-alpha-mannosidase [Setomelanomma holmii]